MPRAIESFRARSNRWDRLTKISAHELGRPRARLGNPNTGIPEIVVMPVFDIYAAAEGQPMGKLSLFLVPQGQTYNFNGVTAFTKGPGHTSIVQPGMLESSYTYIVRALSLYCQGVQGGTHGPYLCVADILNFTSSYVNFRINKKSYYEGIGAWLGGGAGPTYASAGSCAAVADLQASATNGWPVASNIYSIPGGQYINPQENFDCIIDPSLNAGGTPSCLGGQAVTAGVPQGGIMAWFRLDGTLIRVAQ